jgi:hypothetical protein
LPYATAPPAAAHLILFIRAIYIHQVNLGALLSTLLLLLLQQLRLLCIAQRQLTQRCCIWRLQGLPRLYHEAHMLNAKPQVLLLPILVLDLAADT